MRVVLLTTALARGGAESQVAQLAAGLRAAGDEVAIISLTEPARDSIAGGVPVYSLRMRPGSPNPLGLVRLVLLLRRLRPHVLHAHMFHANLMARLASVACPVPVISTLHSLAESARTSPDTRRRDLVYRLTDALSTVTVGVCQAVAERHAQAKAVSRRRLRVIPNAVDTGRFRPDSGARARVRAELGLGDEFTWLAAGRLMWKKDYATLLQAFGFCGAGSQPAAASQAASVRRQDAPGATGGSRADEGVHPACLLIAGEGPQETELRAMAPAGVRFLGARDDIPELMQAADGFVLSSVVEGLPVALLEAAASGLVCVSTDAGGAREIVPSAFLVPQGDAAALAGAMLAVMQMAASERARIGEQMRSLAVAGYDTSAAVRRWRALYREIAQPAEPAGVAEHAGPVQMDITNRFVLDFAIRHGGRVLDFGCGAGAVVAAGRAAGLDILGADVFYAGSEARAEAERAGLLGSSVLEIRDGRLPFPDASFDLVVNNQVMEHVQDLDAALAEIHRVLRPGGTVLSIFPSRDVWREGHIGIPLSHRLRKGSRVRFCYAWLLRALGFGYWKDQASSARQWAADKLAWIDRHTVYRSRRDISGAYDRCFINEFREPEYIRYRLRDNPRRAFLARLLDVPGASAAASALFRKLAFLVIVSRKK